MTNDIDTLLEKIEQVLDANIKRAPGATYNRDGTKATSTSHTRPDRGRTTIETSIPLVRLREDTYPTLAVAAHRTTGRESEYGNGTAILSVHTAHRPGDNTVNGEFIDNQLREIANRAGLQEHDAKGRSWEIPPHHYSIVDDGDHHHYIPGRPDGDNLTMDPIPNHRRSLHIRAEDQGKLLDAVRQLRADHDQPPKGNHVESAVDQSVIKQQERNRS